MNRRRRLPVDRRVAQTVRRPAYSPLASAGTPLHSAAHPRQQRGMVSVDNFNFPGCSRRFAAASACCPRACSRPHSAESHGTFSTNLDSQKRHVPQHPHPSSEGPRACLRRFGGRANTLHRASISDIREFGQTSSMWGTCTHLNDPDNLTRTSGKFSEASSSRRRRPLAPPELDGVHASVSKRSGLERETLTSKSHVSP